MVQLSVHHFCDLLRKANYFFTHKFGSISGLSCIKWFLFQKLLIEAGTCVTNQEMKPLSELTWWFLCPASQLCATRGDTIPRAGKDKDFRGVSMFLWAVLCGSETTTYILPALQALFGQILRLKKTELGLCSSCPQRVCNICKYKTLSFYLCTKRKK